MIDYFQPSFYRFNEDSIKLISYILNYGDVKSGGRILDLGAGVGLLGIELANRTSAKEVSFVELQQENEFYIKKNIFHFLNRQTTSEVFISSFGDWEPLNFFDLIVCNPPYFLPPNCRLGLDNRRNLSRIFLVDGWPILLEKVKRALSFNGRAFFVLRNDLQVKKVIEKNLPQDLAADFKWIDHKKEFSELMILELMYL